MNRFDRGILTPKEAAGPKDFNSLVIFKAAADHLNNKRHAPAMVGLLLVSSMLLGCMKPTPRTCVSPAEATEHLQSRTVVLTQSAEAGFPLTDIPPTPEQLCNSAEMAETVVFSVLPSETPNSQDLANAAATMNAIATQVAIEATQNAPKP